MPFDQARYEQLRMQLVDRNEANIRNLYLDVLGIPTVGLGVALTARQADRTMALDENHVDALADVLNLNPQQRQQLTGLLQRQLVVQNQHVDERHNNLRAFLGSDFGQDSQRVLGPMVNTRHNTPGGSSWSWDVLTSVESPMQVQLTRQQSLDLFNRVAPEYEGRLNNSLRRANCPPEALSEEQRAAIYSMVYQGATGKARRTADSIGDYWRGEITEDQLRTRLRTTVNDPAFPERSRNELEFLENVQQRLLRQAQIPEALQLADNRAPVENPQNGQLEIAPNRLGNIGARPQADQQRPDEQERRRMIEADRPPTNAIPASGPIDQPTRGEQTPSQAQQAAPQASAPGIPENLRDFRHPEHPRQPGFERFMTSLENAQAGYLQGSNTTLSQYNPEQLERIAAGLTAALGSKPFFKEVAEFQLDKEGTLWARRLPVNMDEKPTWAKIDLAQTLAQTPEQSATQWQQAYAPAAATRTAQSRTQSIDPRQFSPDDLRHPDHPRHGMFAQTRGLLATEYDRWGLQRDPAQLDQETAQVVVAARQQRMDGVGGITLTFPPGSAPERPTISLRENPANEFSNRVELKGEQLAQAPQLDQSSVQLQQVEQHLAFVMREEQQNRQEREMGQSQGRSM